MDSRDGVMQRLPGLMTRAQSMRYSFPGAKNSPNPLAPVILLIGQKPMQRYSAASNSTLLTRVLLTPCCAVNWEAFLNWEYVWHRRKEALNTEALRSCGLL
jgi:hypothetical protein